MPVKILSRYTLKEVAVPAFLSLAVVGFLAVAVELREKLKDIPIEHLTGSDVGRLLLYFLPTLVVFVIPITYMMGILLGFGRLSQNNEITAMKAAGIPLKKVVVPVIALGALLSLGTFYLQDRVQPMAMQRAKNLIFKELPLRVTVDMLPTGRMHQFGDWRVYIQRRDPETRTLYGVEILQPNSDGTLNAYWAKSARLIEENGQSILSIPEGHMIKPQGDSNVFWNRLENAGLKVPEIAPQKVRSARQTLTLSQLFAEEGNLEVKYASHKARNIKQELRKVRWEIAERFSLPLSCLAVSLLAAPLAVRGSRGGRSYSFAIGFGIILFYQVLRLLLEPGSLHPLSYNLIVGLLPNILLGLAGMWALWRVDRV
ncbi:MAG: YjgP/YjgQ family permease [bacterium]|nr:YjgP/YjgQ family permease [bacterium]